MSKHDYTIQVIPPDDKSIYEKSYTETVFEILKSVYSDKELNIILNHFINIKGAKIESSNLY